MKHGEEIGACSELRGGTSTESSFEAAPKDKFKMPDITRNMVCWQ